MNFDERSPVIVRSLDDACSRCIGEFDVVAPLAREALGFELAGLYDVNRRPRLTRILTKPASKADQGSMAFLMTDDNREDTSLLLLRVGRRRLVNF